jgi:membrane-associated phospholipid phosphatase
LPPYARPAVLLAVLLLAGVVLAALVSMSAVLPVDLAIAQRVQQPRTIDAFLIPLMILVSAPGYYPWTIILWGVALLLLLLRRDWVAAVLVALTALASALAELLKLIIARPRPTSDLVEVYRAVSGYSFPSGHVVHYVAFFGILGYLAWRRLGASPPPATAARVAVESLLVVCCGLIVLVGPSRVFLGAHWPTDVVAGYLFGGACLVLLVVIGERMYRPSPQG